MAKDENKRIRPQVLSVDRDSLAALHNISGYAPANTAYTMTALTTAQTELDAAQAAEAQAIAAFNTARDAVAAAEWKFHNLVLGMKDQVTAQYGRDSQEVQMIGMKRASERKSPGPRGKKGGKAT
jgi:hypothetical protein